MCYLVEGSWRVGWPTGARGSAAQISFRGPGQAPRHVVWGNSSSVVCILKFSFDYHDILRVCPAGDVFEGSTPP